jgi:hypothetical protein
MTENAETAKVNKSLLRERKKNVVYVGRLLTAV